MGTVSYGETSVFFLDLPRVPVIRLTFVGQRFPVHDALRYVHWWTRTTLNLDLSPSPTVHTPSPPPTPEFPRRVPPETPPTVETQNYHDDQCTYTYPILLSLDMHVKYSYS